MADLAPENDPASPVQKPGYKTTEFWIILGVTLLGALTDAGVFPETSPVMKVVAMVVSLLAALGYTAKRGFVKANGNTAAALVAAAASAPPANPPPA